jgi:hypothetical protein
VEDGYLVHGGAGFIVTPQCQFHGGTKKPADCDNQQA